MKTIIFAVAVLSFCALPYRCFAQNVTPVIYLSPAETAKAKQVAQELKNAENRQRRADGAWHNFYQSYQTAHPEMPNLVFASDFRFALSRANSSNGMDEVASVALSPKEQRTAESLNREFAEALRAVRDADKKWSAFQNEVVVAHTTSACTTGGVTVGLPSGKQATVCSPWGYGLAFTPDFKIAIPKRP